MTAPTLQLYPSAQLKNNIDIEQIMKQKLKYVNSSNILIKVIKKMITYFKDYHHKSEKKKKKIHIVKYNNKIILIHL